METIKRPVDFCSEELDFDASALDLSSLKTDQSKGTLPTIAVPEDSLSEMVCNRTESGTMFLSGLIAKTEDEFERLMSNLQGDDNIHYLYMSNIQLCVPF